MTPAPLATTRGAPVPDSYFSATATWVGLTSTTSAVATSAIIRLRLISRWRPRSAPFWCGSPSDCRCSRLISSRLIRMPFSTRRRSIR